MPKSEDEITLCAGNIVINFQKQVIAHLTNLSFYKNLLKMPLAPKKMKVHYLRKNNQNKCKFFEGDEKNL